MLLNKKIVLLVLWGIITGTRAVFLRGESLPEKIGKNGRKKVGKEQRKTWSSFFDSIFNVS